METYEEETLNQLIDRFNMSIESVSKKEHELEILRKSFVKDYPIERIKKLSLDEYVVGFKKSSRNVNYHTFCYRLEYGLKELGSMKGAGANKFGIYYSYDIDEYVFTNKWGSSIEEAFGNIKDSIYNLLNNRSKTNSETIDDSKLSPMFKYKLLATYFPNEHLCIFNEEHLDMFIGKLNIINDENSSVIDKQNILIGWKNGNKLTENWDNYKLEVFLYDYLKTNDYQIEYDTNAEKRYDNKYPKKGQYNIGITINEWKEMLNNDKIFYEKDLRLLQQIYRENHHSATCYELSIINGTSTSSYNSQVVSLAKRILEHTGKSPNIRENGDKKYWDVVFWGQYRDNHHFEWKIKPKLAAALKKAFPDLISNSINDELDIKLNEDMQYLPISKSIKYEYSKGAVAKPKPNEVIKGTRVYSRSRTVALNALGIANFKCEISNNHETFMRKRYDIPYTEPHHLIPMKYQGDFDVSIDVEQNIVSLCSNCHNEIHFGKDAKELIEQLYEKRKEKLKDKGIYISLEKLLKYYNN